MSSPANIDDLQPRTIRQRNVLRSSPGAAVRFFRHVRCQAFPQPSLSPSPKGKVSTMISIVLRSSFARSSIWGSGDISKSSNPLAQDVSGIYQPQLALGWSTFAGAGTR
ncbi:hypothetical protein HRR80_000650 [Exophiala dermatitidis]|uniref:Uncharacterized protein n=1 Tax=Exophiala dermatitidis TaxID=5970 RepID=A0AAN6F1S5_EXODE|nr:hypothetical protein HRR80_000650 [Exophiala dermatitidis]